MLKSQRYWSVIQSLYFDGYTVDKKERFPFSEDTTKRWVFRLTSIVVLTTQLQTQVYMQELATRLNSSELS